MATPTQWIAGARPRTLPAAVAPVLAATGVVAYFHHEIWWKAALALLVAVLLQVGVNYANDYSDGIRGTDADRVGPMRLVGSGAAAPARVKHAAFLAFGAAAVAGLVLAASTAWWLVAVGLVCILAAWFYTGGSKPYGYLGLGEVMVFCFFGLVAVLGTVFVQEHDRSGRPRGALDNVANPWPAAVWAAIGIGAIACAILVANNLRDISSDLQSGKMTLAVRLGDRRTRILYAALTFVAFVSLVDVAANSGVAALIALVAFVPLIRATYLVLRGVTGPGLVLVLQRTGAGELLYGAGILIGLLVAR